MNVRFAIVCALLLSAIPLSAQNTTPDQTSTVPPATPPVTSASESGTSDLSKIDPAKVANIRTLQEVRGDKRNAVQVMDTMLSSMRPLLSKSLPPGEYRDKLVDLFMQKVRTGDLAQQILDEAVPIYDKYLSDDDVKGLIAFYQTPIGRKLASVTPAMTAELQRAGEKKGEEVGRQAMLQVLAENPDLAKALQDAANAAKQQ